MSRSPRTAPHDAANLPPPRRLASNRNRPTRGGTGIDAMRRPSSVTTSPRTASIEASTDRACAAASALGRSSQGKDRGSNPAAINRRNGAERSSRTIAGSPWVGRRRNSDSVYRRTHRPGRTRPARPARCVADERSMGSVTSRSRSRSRSNRATLARPESTTVVTRGMVIEVSAMLVATTILLGPSVATAASWAAGGRPPWSGTT